MSKVIAKMFNNLRRLFYFFQLNFNLYLFYGTKLTKNIFYLNYVNFDFIN